MSCSVFPHRQHQQGQKLPEQQLSLKPADSLVDSAARPGCRRRREPELLCPSTQEEPLWLRSEEDPSLCLQAPLLPGNTQKAQPEPCSSSSPAG
ncbi:unnamed protein product [Rangifer tarandus platyrhynchus]|uniref:Uncharacterized protein n=1 Tax=Rangifer tarandus platyrhynchus TaxID=3082113 RepID=A0AC59ZV02_RANTA